MNEMNLKQKLKGKISWIVDIPDREEMSGGEEYSKLDHTHPV